VKSHKQYIPLPALLIISLNIVQNGIILINAHQIIYRTVKSIICIGPSITELRLHHLYRQVDGGQDDSYIPTPYKTTTKGAIKTKTNVPNRKAFV